MQNFGIYLESGTAASVKIWMEIGKIGAKATPHDHFIQLATATLHSSKLGFSRKLDLSDLHWLPTLWCQVYLGGRYGCLGYRDHTDPSDLIEIDALANTIDG